MPGFLELADGRRVEVRDGLTLGRVAPCDVVVSDTKASRRHARLVVEGSVVEIEDLGSSNGTFLNDKKIQRRLLRDGDRIRIGKTTVVFAEQESGAAGAPEDIEIELEMPARTAEPEAVPKPPPKKTGEDIEIEIEPAIESPEPAHRPRPQPADPYRPGGGLEGDPLAGREPLADDLEVLEFVDETVTVKRRAEPAPQPASRPAARKDPGSSAREHGVLTFQKKPVKGGVLGDDMRQMSQVQRFALIVAALAAAAGVGWVVMKIAAGV